MLMLYLPGSSRPAGKLNWPLSFDTTVVVMVEPSFLALTSTPSIMSSSAEETWPLSVCACVATTRANEAVVASRSDLHCMDVLPRWVDAVSRALRRFDSGNGQCGCWHFRYTRTMPARP